MTNGWRATLLAGLGAIRIFGAESGFALVLPTVPGALFSRGGTVTVPIGAVRSLEFQIGASAAKHIPDGAVHIRINGGVADPVAVHQAGLTLLVKDEDNKDLFSATMPNKISLTVTHMPELNRDWIVLRAETLYATETVGDEDGLPLEIRFEKSPFPLAGARGEAIPVNLQGKLNRGAGAKISSADRELTVTSSDGFTSVFRGSVELKGNQDMLLIEARAKSATCRIFASVERF